MPIKKANRLYIGSLFDSIQKIILLLFPFNGARRLGGDVIDYSVDSGYFVADPAAHFVQDFPGEAEVVGGHAVGTGNSADAYGVVVGSFVALYAYGTDGCGENGEGLPDIIVEAVLFDNVSDNEVCTAENIQSFRSDFADDANGKARAREGLTVDYIFRKSQFTAQFSDFVLEEFTKRFDKGEFHILRESAHVVMGLDGGSGRCAGFDNVRVKGALNEEFHIGELVCFFLESVNEFSADDLSLLLRFGYTFEEGEEVLGSIDVYELDIEFLGEGIHNLFCFAETEEPVIDKYAGELFADGFVYEDSCNGGVNTAGKGADDIVIAYLFADVFHSDINVVAHGPSALAFADAEQEVFQHLCAFGGMNHFRMELNAEEAAGFIRHSSSGCQFGMTGEAEAGGHIGNSIAVAHPYSGLFGNAFKESGAAVSVEVGMAVFSLFRLGYFAAQGLCHELHAVADAEDRNACLKYIGVDLGGVFCIDAGRAAGENDAFGILCQDFLGCLVVRKDFAVYTAFTYAAGDELCVLASEVNNDHDFLMLQLNSSYGNMKMESVK